MSELDREGLQAEPQGSIPESVRCALVSYVPLGPGQVFPTAPDTEGVRGLVESCRRHVPDASDDEIVHFIHDKGAIAKRDRVSDPVSYLLTSVPECFAGGEISRYRAELAERATRAEKAKKNTEEGWICPQCNATVNSPRISDKKKRICQLGHEVEKPMGFLGGLVAIVALIVLAALASHALGWIWSLPARLLNTFTVEFGTSFLPLFGLAKGLRHLFRSSPARRLAGGYLGMMLGGALMFVLVMYSMDAATARPDGRLGVVFNPLCVAPEKPYYTDRSSERVYRFFLPYGLYNGFTGGCGE